MENFYFWQVTKGHKVQLHALILDVFHAKINHRHDPHKKLWWYFPISFFWPIYQANHLHKLFHIGMDAFCQHNLLDYFSIQGSELVINKRLYDKMKFHFPYVLDKSSAPHFPFTFTGKSNNFSTIKRISVVSIKESISFAFHKGYSLTDGKFLFLASNRGMELFHIGMDAFCQHNLLDYFSIL